MSKFKNLLSTDDIPEDVCEPRAAESGMAIVWVFIFGLIYLIIGLIYWMVH